MPLSALIATALGSLASNKLRSFLAMLGIIIGVGSVISMLALGTGAQKQVMERFESMGSNLLFVRPGQRGSRGRTTGRSETLTVKDAEALLEEVPMLAQVSPVSRGNVQVKYMDKNVRTNVMGTAVTYFPMRAYDLEKGRAFTEIEVERNARVAVIGSQTAEELFATEDPIGKVMKVNGQNFAVVGLLKTKGDQGWFNPDDVLMTPYTTAMNKLLGSDHLDEIDVQIKGGTDHAAAEEAIAAVLRRRHKIRPGEEDDFNVRNMAEWVEASSDAAKTFSFLLGGIAGISLLVGGIGIMNIMLVSVTERTREIGVRKAIGAKDRDVLAQFLIEAVVMSATGGLLGVAMGVGFAKLVPDMAGFKPVVETASAVLALGFAGGVGVVFGFYPAWRASLLNPIDALRYE